MENLIQTLAIYALPVLFAITLHEAAHGQAARMLGDETAWRLGRVTMNPLRHIDPFGTILAPILLLLASSGQFMFGWAKPVPVMFERLRRPKRDMLWVAGAGPAANLVMVLLWGLLLKLSLWLPHSIWSLPLAEMSRAGVTVNAVFMLLNLLPILPLDGGRMLFSLLPHSLAAPYARLEPWGLFIVLGLLLSGMLNELLGPMLGSFLLVIKSLLAI